jgi:hypothetical protein
MRILLDPSAVEFVGGAAPQGAAPLDEFERRLAQTLKKLGVAAAPPATAAAPAIPFGPEPEWERVSRSEVARLREAAQTLDQLRVDQERGEEERRIKEGKWEELVKDYKDKLEGETRKLQERDRAFKASLRDRELASALAQHSLLPGAARQLLALVRDQFDVHDEGGQVAVKSRGFDPVDEAVRQILAQPEYAHFLRPTSQGGVGATAAQLTHQTPSPLAGALPPPTNLGEAIVQQWQTRRQQATASPGMLPVGLGGKLPHSAPRRP